jgi:hypothetical protein
MRGVAGIRSALNQSALQFREPTSIRADRPLLVGFDANRSRWRAEWVQRDIYWFLDVSKNAVPERVQFEELVTRSEQQIADLP